MSDYYPNLVPPLRATAFRSVSGKVAGGGPTNKADSLQEWLGYRVFQDPRSATGWSDTSGHVIGGIDTHGYPLLYNRRTGKLDYNVHHHGGFNLDPLSLVGLAFGQPSLAIEQTGLTAAGHPEAFQALESGAVAILGAAGASVIGGAAGAVTGVSGTGGGTGVDEFSNLFSHDTGSGSWLDTLGGIVHDVGGILAGGGPAGQGPPPPPQQGPTASGAVLGAAGTLSALLPVIIIGTIIAVAFGVRRR